MKGTKTLRTLGKLDYFGERALLWGLLVHGVAGAPDDVARVEANTVVRAHPVAAPIVPLEPPVAVIEGVHVLGVHLHPPKGGAKAAVPAVVSKVHGLLEKVVLRHVLLLALLLVVIALLRAWGPLQVSKDGGGCSGKVLLDPVEEGLVRVLLLLGFWFRSVTPPALSNRRRRLLRS